MKVLDDLVEVDEMGEIEGSWLLSTGTSTNSSDGLGDLDDGALDSTRRFFVKSLV